MKDIEVVVRRASERLAMLRAFEMSQTEANSDSLTGLVTRRSLETRDRDLRHRHALRRGLRRSGPLQAAQRRVRSCRRRPRPADLLAGASRCAPAVDVACRYGGEEFVILLPACPIAEAPQVLDRIRNAWRAARRAGFRRSRPVSAWRPRTRLPTSRGGRPGRRGPAQAKARVGTRSSWPGAERAASDRRRAAPSGTQR